MHWTNITTIVGESTRIVNSIKSLTVPCGSRLVLIFFLSGRCFSCCLLGAGTTCSPEAVGFPTGCSYFDRLGWPGLRNVKLFPPGCSFLDREHDLRKKLIHHQIHSTKNLWEWNSNWLLASLIEMIRRWDGAACMIGFTWKVMIVVFVDLVVAVFRVVKFFTRGHAWRRYVSCKTAAHTRTFGAVWTRP